MGYGTRNNGQIKTFEPDDTEDEFYLASHCDNTMADILEKAQAKWPGITLDQITIQADYIHTDCLTYDQYCASDHTNYLRITKTA